MFSLFDDENSDHDIERRAEGFRAKGIYSETNKRDIGEKEVEDKPPSDDADSEQAQTTRTYRGRPTKNSDLLVTSRFTATTKNPQVPKLVAPCPLGKQPAEFDKTNKPPSPKGQTLTMTTTKSSTDREDSINTEQMEGSTSFASTIQKRGSPRRKNNETLPRASPASRFDWVDLIANLSGKDEALNKARIRNVTRLREANENDGTN